MTNYLFTSESVTMGHPDKVADQISDAVLDSLIVQDKRSRVACETLVTTGLAFVAGEITTRGYAEIPRIVRDTIKDIGYTSAEMGFDYETCAVVTSIDKQSPDISQGVTTGKGLHREQGAGDQGMMFGFACRETSALMPMPIHAAHRLVEKLAQVRRAGKVKYLRPDGKSQVTVEYANGRPKRIHTVVISTQHDPDVKYATIRKDMINKVIKPVLGKMIDRRTVFHVNPTGRFVTGGPQGDCGLTGRKIIVDTYGGMGAHGGGAFSGKDPSKVDRSASYAARYIAKNIVAARIAKTCEVQLAYAIGVAEPVSILVNTNGTGEVADEKLAKAIRKIFPIKPVDIISKLNLLRPIYRKTACHGHFGRTGKAFTWEKTDKVKELRRAFKLK